MCGTDTGWHHRVVYKSTSELGTLLYTGQPAGSQAVSSIGRCTMTVTLHYDRVGGCLLDSFLNASAGTIGWLVTACATIDTLHYASVDNSIIVKTGCKKHADAHTHLPYLQTLACLRTADDH